MASAATTLLKSSFLPKKAEWGSKPQLVAAHPRPATVVVSMVARASAYADELVQTAVYIYIYIYCFSYVRRSFEPYII
jgi:hypothetical protein